jgi:hypothetical protein
LAVGAFGVGYLIEQGRVLQRRLLLRQLWIIVATLAVAVALIGTFVVTRMAVIETVQNTAYPGQRLTRSGGFDVAHLFSGHTSFGLQSSETASHYSLPTKGLTNQSENSNFLLVFPYLMAPCLLLLVNVAFLGALAWLFVPHLGAVGKLLFLERVPHTRLLIGIGLLNFIGLVLFGRRLQEQQTAMPGRKLILGYSAALLLVQELLSLHVMRTFPGFMHAGGFFVSLIPVPLIGYLALRGRFTQAVSVLLVFSAAMTVSIHPLYRGTAALTRTPLSQSVRAINAEDPGAGWAIEEGIAENFAYMNGARSLSGVYPYPHLNLWRSADERGQQDKVYNRYAHVWFTFDRDPARMSPTTFTLTSADHFLVNTEPCGPFLRQHHVKYLVTRTAINESCLGLRDTVRYPAAAYLVYEFW